jgi:uncharacterized protein (TIGR01777 family)
MKVLIAGGTGMVGRALTPLLLANGHRVWVLTRDPQGAHLSDGVEAVGWDGVTTEGWGDLVNQVEAIVNLTGKSLASWPWTAVRKKRFQDSRVLPGRALAAAVERAVHRPRVFLQASGINHYGLRGDEVATEETAAGDDFLAQLTVDWENASRRVEEYGVRWIAVRSAVVLANRGGLMPLMAMSVRLFVGGRLGSGRQAVPWIHLDDEVAAMSFLLEDEKARGPFNLVAPGAVSNIEFYRALAQALHHPYWFSTPAFLLRIALGEMSVMVLEGRYARPKRLLELGYQFRYERIEGAFSDLFG